MPKKTFTAAPQPAQLSEAQIQAFEQGGAGHDTHAQSLTSTEPARRLSLDLPQSLHMRFKAACGATGRKMGAEVQTFIETRIRELEDEAGITRK